MVGLKKPRSMKNGANSSHTTFLISKVDTVGEPYYQLLLSSFKQGNMLKLCLTKEVCQQYQLAYEPFNLQIYKQEYDNREIGEVVCDYKTRNQ